MFSGCGFSPISPFHSRFTFSCTIVCDSRSRRFMVIGLFGHATSTLCFFPSYNSCCIRYAGGRAGHCRTRGAGAGGECRGGAGGVVRRVVSRAATVSWRRRYATLYRTLHLVDTLWWALLLAPGPCTACAVWLSNVVCGCGCSFALRGGMFLFRVRECR